MVKGVELNMEMFLNHGDTLMNIQTCFRPVFLVTTLLSLNPFYVGAVEQPASLTDIAIIGSGSAAFSAATYAASRGAKVTMIEENVIGGTCVNVGCVPSKIFIRAAQVAHTSQAHPFDGIERHRPSVRSDLLLYQQQSRVTELRDAKYESVLASNPNISFMRGFACFSDKNTLVVSTPDQSDTILRAQNILIATGSVPHIPNIQGLHGTPFWNSTQALFSGKIPEHLIVIGGSYIACELSQSFLRLGSKVTMLVRSTLLSREDPELGQGLKQVFEGEGMHVLTNTLPESVAYDGGIFSIDLGGQKIINGDHLLVATGRQANTKKLGLEKTGVSVDSLGSIVVNEHMNTNVPNIYAAGDCTTQPQYVYVAAAAGNRAAMNMLGRSITLDLSIVPAVVFTDPQIATVGISAQQAEIQGYEVETRTLPLNSVPRALANFDTRGFIKLVVDRRSQKILGSQILASEAGDMIQSVALAIRNNMTVKRFAGQLFPYLTMVEGLKLCAQTFYTDVKKLSCCSDVYADEEEDIAQAVSTTTALSHCCQQLHA